MKIITSSIIGVVIIESRLFRDERDYFGVFQSKGILKKVCKTVFVQDNEVKSPYWGIEGYITRNHLLLKVN